MSMDLRGLIENGRRILLQRIAARLQHYIARLRAASVRFVPWLIAVSALVLALVILFVSLRPVLIVSEIGRAHV